MFKFDDVRLARDHYESMLADGRSLPPPCTLDLKFARVVEWDSAPVIAATFPAPCVNAVAGWMRNALGGDITGTELAQGAKVFEALRSNSTQILESNRILAIDAQAG
jgi:hypothetical protein